MGRRFFLSLILVLGIVVVPRVADVGAAGTFDGRYAYLGKIGAGQTLTFVAAGRGLVPASGVGSVVLNVTVTSGSQQSFLAVFPAGTARPGTSNVNFRPGQTVANSVVTRVGAGGAVSVFNMNGTVDVIVDVVGWFPAGGQYRSASPARFMDTRATGRTIDSVGQAIGAIPSGGVVNLPVAGRGRVPESGVSAVIMNVTAVNGTARSSVTVWPTGTSRPSASSLNFEAGSITPNLVVAKLGRGGRVSFFNMNGAVDVLVDVVGWFESDGGFTPLEPARLMDTRPGRPTVDGEYSGDGKLPGGGTWGVKVTGRGGVPEAASVKAVALNVTAVGGTVPSSLTVWKGGLGRPGSSNLNFPVGQAVANLVLVEPSRDGFISLFNMNGGVDVVIDVVGWFAKDGAYYPLRSARFVDTRIPTPSYFSPGVLRVGVDIQPGRYVAEAARYGCYWERQSGFSGSSGDIIANDFRGEDGRVIVDLVAGDLAFDFTSDCGTLQTFYPVPQIQTQITPGSHAVRVHLNPGTYVASTAYGCYWERLSGFTGNLAEIIDNDFVGTGGVRYVTILSSDVGFFTNEACGVWSKV